MSVDLVRVGAVTDTVLQSLRTQILDESEPLAGLLRKCLMLGAETHSETLRDWARRELNGYRDEEEVPDYRQLFGPSIMMDSMSGNTWATNQMIDRLNLPQETHEYVKDSMPLRQPIEELERLATEKSITFRSGALSYAETVWNSQLGPYQQVMNLRYTLSSSAFAGVVGQVRTKLVDIVADLTAGAPITELPATARVDAVMRERVGHVGDVYNTSINQPTGPTAVGSESTAKTEGLTVADVLALLAQVQQAISNAPANDERTEAEAALVELREVVEQGEPDTGEVVRRTGRLRSAVSKLGNVAATTATTRAAGALTDMAMNGTFF